MFSASTALTRSIRSDLDALRRMCLRCRLPRQPGSGNGKAAHRRAVLGATDLVATSRNRGCAEETVRGVRQNTPVRVSLSDVHGILFSVFDIPLFYACEAVDDIRIIVSGTVIVSSVIRQKPK